MLLSNLFIKHKEHRPKFAPMIFLFLLTIFIFIGDTRPVMALVGIGTIVTIAAVLVLINRDAIWDDYRDRFKKNKGLKGVWVEPNRVYYNINVFVLWPFVLVLGILCLISAYAVS
ncbi:MAG: hypothetical protein K0S68_60 [Candidatus Saccharibacteria bacterium]|jgi:hypothetical protein|nr:hypothetical protein [Candidatus Saccharibacteria bacterium]